MYAETSSVPRRASRARASGSRRGVSASATRRAIVVLHGEDVRGRRVERLAPHRAAVPHVHEPDGDTEPVVHPLEAPFDDRVDAQVPPHRLRRRRRPRAERPREAA